MDVPIHYQTIFRQPNENFHLLFSKYKKIENLLDRMCTEGPLWTKSHTIALSMIVQTLVLFGFPGCGLSRVGPGMKLISAWKDWVMAHNRVGINRTFPSVLGSVQLPDSKSYIRPLNMVNTTLWHFNLLVHDRAVSCIQAFQVFTFHELRSNLRKCRSISKNKLLGALSKLDRCFLVVAHRPTHFSIWFYY